MKRIEAKTLQKKYGMEIMRNPITSEAWGLYISTDRCIPELDALSKQDIYPCAMEVCYNHPEDGALYRLACPTSWFDLYGWADEK